MKVDFDLDEHVQRVMESESYFRTFINRASLAAGVLVLEPGEDDTQEPHESDEVYYVISGSGYLRINGKDYIASRGRLFFVARDTEHFFHGNRGVLKVLYFFGGSDG